MIIILKDMKERVKALKKQTRDKLVSFKIFNKFIYILLLPCLMDLLHSHMKMILLSVLFCFLYLHYI